MTSVVIDPATGARLCGAHQPVELLDDTGRLLGFFVPALDVAKSSAAEPKITEEELQRRERAGGGRPLADILRDLEKKA